MARHIGDCIYICEEFHLFCNYQHISPALDQLIRFGRHWNVSLIGISQRLVDYPKILTSMIDLLVMFKTTETRDLDALRKLSYVGESGVQKLLQLPQYQYCLFFN